MRARIIEKRGFGVIELVVALALLALMILIAMPGMLGYQNTSAMQTTARQFVSDLRAAQEQALSQTAQVDVVFTVSGAAVTGYTVQRGSTVLSTVVFSSSVHATSTWPANDIAFTPTGAVTGPGATPALCIDNQKGLTNTVSLTLATGRVALASGSGSC